MLSFVVWFQLKPTALQPTRARQCLVNQTVFKNCHTPFDMDARPAKRACLTSQQRRPLDLANVLQEALYWSRVVYGQHPSALLPPPAGMEQLKSAEPELTVPPSIARVLDRWVKCNPIYGTAPLERHGGNLDEKSRTELLQTFLANLPQRMRDAPFTPELSTAAFENHMLTLGRRYGTAEGGLVPVCCNGSACASLKVKKSFGTPLQRYYTPSEDEKLLQDPSLVAAFGAGPCLICLRHDVDVLVKCNVGRSVRPQEAFGQPYAVMLRVYNSVDVPGGYRSSEFSNSPVETPDISPVPFVSSKSEEISWMYNNSTQTWYIDQSALLFNPGQDF